MKRTPILIMCLGAALISACTPPVDRTETDPPAPPTTTPPTTPPPASTPAAEAGQATGESQTRPNRRPVEPRTDPNSLVKTHASNLVFVSGQGAGSGFIANFGSKTFLVTNAHVAAGVRNAAFRTLQGASVPVGPASVAVGHDILAMEVPKAGTALEIMRDVGSNVAINDEVVVLGNAEGGGVINTIVGRLVGVGPDLVEIDAAFQPGNSGSPIIHLKTGKVIGVATYLTIRKYDATTRNAIQDPVIRRFGYRVDSVKTWQPINWTDFQAQATQMESIEKLTEDFIDFIRDIADDSRVTTGRHTNPAIRTRIDAWLSSKSKRMSAPDALRVEQNFMSFLKVASQSDLAAAQQRLTYDYFRRQLAEQQRERSEITALFGKIIESTR